MSTTPLNPLQVGDKVVVINGCRDKKIAKRDAFKVEEIQPLGADYSHAVKVVLVSHHIGRVVFYARHLNRLSEEVITLHDGNPLHKIRIKRKP